MGIFKTSAPRNDVYGNLEDAQASTTAWPCLSPDDFQEAIHKEWKRLRKINMLQQTDQKHHGKYRLCPTKTMEHLSMLPILGSPWQLGGPLKKHSLHRRLCFCVCLAAALGRFAEV